MLVLVARGQGDSEQFKMSLRLKQYGLVDRESRSHAATTAGDRLPSYIHLVSGAIVTPDVSRPRGASWFRGATSATGLCAEGRFELQKVSKSVAAYAEKWYSLLRTHSLLTSELLRQTSKTDVQWWRPTYRVTKNFWGNVYAELGQ